MGTVTVRRKPFFYDHQIKRYLAQLMSCFAGYQVRTGKQRDSQARMIDVPIIHGDHSRIAAWALSGGNENKAFSLPAMALEMSRLKQDAKLRRAPTHQETVGYIEKTEAGTMGRHMTVERYMPVPYDMGVRLSIWASNNEQLHQILEQILVVFNPELDIILSNSPLDWSFKTVLTFDGNISLGRSSADVGAGTGDDQSYVASLDFTTTIHLSPPTKVYETKVIETVHVPIKTLNEQIDWDTMDVIDTLVITGTGS